jgi:putative ABC transport system permease protein
MAKILNLLPWRRRRLEESLDRELQYHLDRRAEDLRQEGLSDVEARRRAVLELGGVAQVEETVRETWVWRWLDDRGRDLRYAIRTLWRSPSFAATAVLSVALGIGANAAIFSLVDEVILRPLSVADAERLVYMHWRGNSLSSSWGSYHLLSYPLCRDLDAQGQFFDGVFCRHPTNVTFSTGQQHQPVPAEIVSGSYFPVLGVQPAAGRLIDRSDDLQPGAHPVVVLSHGYWQNNLGGASDVVGRKVLVNNQPMTVIGIAPASFRGVDPFSVPAVWIPAAMKRQATPEWDRLLDRRAAWMHVFGRLKPGVTIEQATAGLQPWFKSVLDSEMKLDDFPSVSVDERRAFLASALDLRPGSQGLSGLRGAIERPLLVLMGGTLLLILLSSLNVASLLLARGAARGREVATRLALGASRGRIASQLLLEGLVIALAGGLLGLVTSPLVIGVLRTFLPDDADLASRIDYRVFGFALLMAVITGTVCGLAPALQAGRRPLSSWNTRSSVGLGGVRLRKAIVVAQIAFALVLLIGAGLFVQTLSRLHRKDPGFASAPLLMFYAEPDAIGYPETEAPRVMRDLLGKLQGAPVVERAAIANSQLLEGGSARRTLTIEADRRVVTERPLPIMRVGPGFFATLGTPVVAGREFDDNDTRDVDKTGFRSAIVNERFARRYFGGKSPIGRRVGIGNQPNTVTGIEIVGMVRDFSFRSLRDDPEPEHVFFPFAAAGPLAGNGTLYVKVRGDAEAALASIRAAVADVDPRLPLIRLTTLDGRIERSLRSERMLATLSSGFGAIALLLCVVGLYGVMSFVVTRRTQEIGVRLALGATRPAAVWLVIRDALFMIAAGTAIGLPSAWALRRVIEEQLFGVRAFDTPTVTVACCLLALVAVGAAMLPAWRAATVSPMEALRAE